MAMRKMLGKICMAEFGVIRDYPFLMGLQLGFKHDEYKDKDKIRKICQDRIAEWKAKQSGII